MAETPKPCSRKHHMPTYWRDVREGNSIKTYCTLCGKFIGQRPADTGKKR